MIREADREDQIAAARGVPRNATIQLPDAPVEVAKSVTSAGSAAAPAPANPQTAAVNTKPAAAAPVEDLPSYVPAPKSLISDHAASEVATVNPGNTGTQNAVLTSLPKASETSLDTKLGTKPVAQLMLLKGDDVMKVGEKRRYAVQLNSDVPLSLVLLALKFDPKVVKINRITAGNLLSDAPAENAPLVTPSIDVNGVCMVSISALNGKGSFKGSGTLLFIDLEAVGAGDAALVFVKDTLHLVATDARDVASEVIQGTATVKQQ